jgi:ABC-type transport system substrate-binding protein
MEGDLKITRIKARHKAELSLLGDAVSMAQERVPLLKATAETRRETRSMTDQLSSLAKYTKANGFDPTRTFQHVANFDTAIWTLILDMFARYDADGNQIDDGLLYKWNQERGNLELNRDFFYALLSYFEAQGISCDLRGKIILN